MDLLIDSCSYLRIARNIHPLLGHPLGSSGYKLFIHSYFNDEYNKNLRLLAQFPWVNESEYIDNRKKSHVKLLSHQGNEILNTYTFINAFKRTHRSSISDVDIFALSTAKVLEISLITDDPDMIVAADDSGITCMKTIEFLNYLYINKVVDDIKLLEIFDFWEYIHDCPTSYNADRKKYFPYLKKKTPAP